MQMAWRERNPQARIKAAKEALDKIQSKCNTEQVLGFVEKKFFHKAKFLKYMLVEHITVSRLLYFIVTCYIVYCAGN